MKFKHRPHKERGERHRHVDGFRRRQREESKKREIKENRGRQNQVGDLREKEEFGT